MNCGGMRQDKAAKTRLQRAVCEKAWFSSAPPDDASEYGAVDPSKRSTRLEGRIADLLRGRERVSSGARKRTLNRGAGATCQIWREGRKAVFRSMWDSPASVVFKGPKGCGATLGGRGDWERRQGSAHHLLREINKECWITQQKREGMLDLSRIASDSITTENP